MLSALGLAGIAEQILRGKLFYRTILISPCHCASYGSFLLVIYADPTIGVLANN